MLSLDALGLGAYADNPLYKKFLSAVNYFLRDLTDPAITHVFVFGSFARGELTRHSDLDLLVVRKRPALRAHEIHTCHGITLEIVTSTREQLLRELHAEKKNHCCRTSSMLAHSRLLVGDSSLRNVLVLARRVLGTPPPALSAQEKAGYQEYIKRLPGICKAYFERGEELNAQLRIDAAIQDLVMRYFHIVRQPIPQYKLMNQKLADAPFKKFLSRALAATNVREKYRGVCAMARGLLILLRKD